MTNYNKRLDEILAKHGAEPGEMTHSLKQAITSLIKELVAEAKPDTLKAWEETRKIGCVDDDAQRGYILAINQFEQNLLKGLEEV